MPEYRSNQPPPPSGGVPKEIRVGRAVILPTLVGAVPGEIEVVSSVSGMSDSELSVRLQDATNAQVHGLDLLGDLEAEVTWLEATVERQMEVGVSRLMTSDVPTSKLLGSGRNSLAPLRGWVADHNPELAAMIERLTSQKSLLIKVRKHVEGLAAQRETLSRQISFRQMEVDKGMRG